MPLYGLFLRPADCWPWRASGWSTAALSARSRPDPRTAPHPEPDAQERRPLLAEIHVLRQIDPGDPRIPVVSLVMVIVEEQELDQPVHPQVPGAVVDVAL